MKISTMSIVLTSLNLMRTIVALGLLTQPRKERFAVGDLVQPANLLAEEWMSTSHAVKVILRSVVVQDVLYGRGGDGVRERPD